jgi:hypothetical protein
MPRRSTGTLAIGSLVLTLALAGCATGSGTPAGAGSATPTASVSTTGPAVVPPAEKPPARAGIEAAMISLAEKNSTGVKIASISDMRVALNSDGVWWAAGTAVPVERDKFDSARIVIKLVGGEWEFAAIGTAVSPEELPVKVRGIL